MNLILQPYLLGVNEGVLDQLITVQILFVKIHCGDLLIFVGGVVIDTLAGVATGSVLGNLVFAITKMTAPPGLCNGTEDMEKLADAFRFAASAAGIELGKCGTDETGLGRKITRQTDGTHASAVGTER